ncbi:MAG: MFS transporter, partial [Terracidiphilus sp.]
ASLAAQRSTIDYKLGGALRTWQWWALWLVLFLNVSAGITLISQEAPIFREIAKVSAIEAGVMVGIVAIGNGVGRIFWAAASDVITRRWTFVVMFLIQVVLFWIMPGLPSRTTLTVVAFVILMCYGGGFGTMPAFAADYFGSRNIGPIYGLMITAWGFGSTFTPLLIAHLRESTGSFTTGLHIISGIMAASTLLPLVIRPPRTKQPAADTVVGHVPSRAPSM